jgi:3-oxoacyl-[acyl-carrier protein] reductase
MDLGIRGRSALVMGGTTGIGRGIATSLVREGAKVGISGRDAGRAQAAAREMGADTGWAADFQKPGDARKLVQAALDRWKSVDVLVVNAGGPPKGKFEEINDGQWRDGFESLWVSAVDAIQTALPAMRGRKWGRIVLVTSLAAREPLAGMTVSNGLRAGLLGLARSLSHEVAKDGITVNAILPGYTDTERLQELGRDLSTIAAAVPTGRLARTEEMGDMAAFLASDRAAYVTGQMIAVDGGITRGI